MKREPRKTNRSYLRRRGAAGRSTFGWNARPARAGESGEAEALIRQGVELRAQKKDERALPLFEKAYQLSRSPRTAGQLGLVEMALGYFVDAEKYLSEAVASPDHPWVAKNLADAEGAARDGEDPDWRALHHRRARRRRGAGERQAGRPAAAVVADPPRQGARRRAGARARLRGVDGLRRHGRRQARGSIVPAAARGGRGRAAAARHPSRSPPRRCRSRVEADAGGAVGRDGDPAARARGRPGRIGSPPASITATPAPADSGDHSNLRPVAWGVGIAGIAGLVFGAVEGVVAIKQAQRVQRSHRPRSGQPAQQTIPDCNTTAPTARLPGHPGFAREREEAVDHRFRRGRRADGGRGGAVGAVVTQGARGRLQHRHRLHP